jgi:hypothetical protein
MAMTSEAAWKETALGFDVRVPLAAPTRSYLLQRSPRVRFGWFPVRYVASVDRDIWPRPTDEIWQMCLPDEVNFETGFLTTAQAAKNYQNLLSKESVLITVTELVPMQTRDSDCKPGQVGELLGFDICDQYETSVITNIGLPSVELELLKPFLDVKTTSWGLIGDAKQAIRLLHDISALGIFKEHQPKRIFGLYLCSAGDSK